METSPNEETNPDEPNADCRRFIACGESMSINNFTCYLESLANWDFLGNLRPTDADGLREKNGHLLLLECKLPGAAIPRSQQITFDAMVARGDTVILVRKTRGTFDAGGGQQGLAIVQTDTGRIVAVQVWQRTSEYAAHESEVLALVSRWDEWARNQPTPSPCAGWCP